MKATFVLRQLPTLVATVVTLAVCFLQSLRLPSIESLEAQTYDWRVCLARSFPSAGATNLGFVFMSDESIARLAAPSHPLRCGLYWPRHIYGRALEELSAQGAKAVGFDILLTGLRPDHAPVQVVGAEATTNAAQFLASLTPPQPVTQVGANVLMESDDYLAWQLRRAGTGILATERDALPADLFATNAAALGDVSADRDRDGVLRRARPFKNYRRWHRILLQAATDYGINLKLARVGSNEIILSPADGKSVLVPLDTNGCFNLADFLGDKLPAGWPAKAKPFEDERTWHMGIILAAAELGLDLTQAQVDERRHELHLVGTNGVSRTIPLDADGAFYIDWSLSTTDSRLLFEPIHSLLDQHLARAAGETNGLTDAWRGRLVLVGASATGNDLTDRGSTPMEKDTLLVSEHWNIANSLLTGRFIQRPPLAVNLAIIAVVGALTALLTWRLRALTAAVAVLALGGIYCGIAAWLYVRWRIWVPLILPVGAAIMVQHVCLVSYRVVFEEREKRRVRSFFAKVVSPDIVQELLRADKLSSFDGAHREVTVMFSDVRGFTDLTDRNRETAVQHICERRLSPQAASIFLDQQARETLLTVNLYLATVADRVKQHTGTLDKYIGDCVMAFWGAPTPNPQHALSAVRAAIDAQRAIAELNRGRAEENQRRATVNPPLPPLPLLSLGSGINTGVAIVGLMGSDDHILNYTVFGREVNLASRLESVSGRGRIVIGEATFRHLERDAPALAARCLRLAPTAVKGIREALVCYEVPWKEESERDASKQARG